MSGLFRRVRPTRLDPLSLLFAVLALSAAVYERRGVFSLPALTLLTLALLLLTLAFSDVVERWVCRGLVRLFSGATREGLLCGLMCLAILACVLAQVTYPRPFAAWQEREDDVVLRVGIGLAGVLAIGGAARRGRTRFLAFTLFLLTYSVLGAHVIRFARPPGIDVYMYHREAAKALLAGQNPYTTLYPDGYPPDLSARINGPGVSVNGWFTYGYPYPPLSVYVATLGEYLFAEPRYLHLLAELLAAATVAFLNPGRIGCLAGALLLLLPDNIRVLHLSWTEPQVLACFAIVIVASARAPRLLPLALGLLVSSKQYIALIAPLFFFLFEPTLPKRAWLRVIAQTAAVALLIAAPFLIWDGRALLKSLVELQFVQPFRLDSLSYLAGFARLTGIKLSPLTGILAASVVLAGVLARAPRNRQGFLGGSACVLCTFFAFNKQAFPNYYALIGGIVVLALGLHREELRHGVPDGAAQQEP